MAHLTCDRIGQSSLPSYHKPYTTMTWLAQGSRSIAGRCLPEAVGNCIPLAPQFRLLKSSQLIHRGLSTQAAQSRSVCLQILPQVLSKAHQTCAAPACRFNKYFAGRHVTHAEGQPKCLVWGAGPAHVSTALY